jgi:hypothetical protein
MKICEVFKRKRKEFDVSFFKRLSSLYFKTKCMETVFFKRIKSNGTSITGSFSTTVPFSAFSCSPSTFASTNKNIYNDSDQAYTYYECCLQDGYHSDEFWGI